MADDIPIQSFQTNLGYIFSLFDFNLILYCLGIAIFLILSTIVSRSKLAIFSLRNNDLKKIKTSDDKRNQLIQKFLEDPKELFSTFVFSITFFSLGVVILTEQLVGSIIHIPLREQQPILFFILKLIIETIIILVFAEFIPRIYHSQNNYETSKNSIQFISVLHKIFSPFTGILNFSSNFLENQLDGVSNTITIEDIDASEKHAPTDEHKRNNTDILKGLLKFGNITVTQIMHSRIDVVAIDKDSTFDELLKTVKDSGYSRIPVYENDIDKICGIIYAKDLLLYLDENSDFNWQQLIKPAFFVPDNKKIDDLLEDFQNRRIHMAIVVDEYGGTLGIATLEDVLEEVIGEIKDEFDDISEIDFKKIDNNNYIFEARTAINDVYKVLGIKDDTFDDIRGDADSLAGLMLEINNDIPKEGDELEYKNYKFIILEANETRVIRVKIVIQ